MRVGFFLYIILIVLLNSVIYAGQGFTLAVNGGISTVKMTGYNDSINTANAYNTSLGINSKLKKLDMAISPEIIMGYDFLSPVGLLGVYLKNSLILLIDSGSNAKWPGGITAQNMNSDLSALYTALGVRVSFASEIIPALAGYAGVDVGLCHYYWNYIVDETYKDTGENLYRKRKEWQTAVPGLSAEAGIDWWFAGSMGISLKGGYRFAAGKVMAKVIDLNGILATVEGEDYMDYSGAFVNAGLIFKFDQPSDDSSKKQVRGSQFPGIALWLYNEAQDLYDEGLYRQAAQKIKEAEDIAPGNARVEELKTKIQAVLKTENNAENVKKLIKQADEFRDKKDFKKARMRYSEALSMDAENKQAKFYLDEFAVKAQASYAAAQAFKQENKPKDALREAKLACDYGGGEDAWELKTALQAQLKNKKEQDRLFNEGVEQFQKGEYKKAAESWAEVVAIDPDDKEAALNLEKANKKLAAEAGDEKTGVAAALAEAKNLYNIGNMADAMKKYEYVLRLNAGNTEAAKMVLEIKKIEEDNKREVLNKR